MMMVSDDCLVECKIDDDSDEDDRGGEQINTPPPPPEFASKTPTPTPTPAPKPPTPPTSPTPTPVPTRPVNRDPKCINQHLKVDVSNVLTEPATPDRVWAYSVGCFERTRIWTYRCLSLLFAVPFALLCGILLAILSSLHVWFLVPCIQLSNTFIPCFRSLCMCAVNVLITPFCVSIALCCSQIAISLSNKDWKQLRDRETV